MLERLASRLGRNDDEPNIALAEYLCRTNDREGVREIAGALTDQDSATVSDCIKVLYEIGYRNPALIASYAEEFILGLLSKNNRLAWGSMIALGTVADLSADQIFPRLDIVKKAYEKGSVITVDNSMTVFAKLCTANGDYVRVIFPLLLEHLRTCRAKEIPQHAERLAICVDAARSAAFAAVLEARRGELTEAQQKRVDKVIKALKTA